jgi:hypothetical protein
MTTCRTIQFHFIAYVRFAGGSGHNPGSQRLGGTIGQFVNEVVLAGQNDGQVGFGVFFKLANGMPMGFILFTMNLTNKRPMAMSFIMTIRP